MKIIEKAFDLIFPPACGICGKLGEGYICKRCYEEIKPYIYQKVENKIFYLLNYKDIIRNKMIEFKFNDKSYLSHMFCEIFVKSKIGCEFTKKYDIIIPIPMYKQKKNIRGYNQSELIAKKIAKHFKVPICTNVLVKYKNTPMQSSLGKEERIKNVQNVYKVNDKEKIKGKKVLLLDDIYTTGATIEECKRIMQLEGNKNIGTIIIAKG